MSSSIAKFLVCIQLYNVLQDIVLCVHRKSYKELLYFTLK